MTNEEIEDYIAERGFEFAKIDNVASIEHLHNWRNSLILVTLLDTGKKILFKEVDNED